MEKNEFEKVDCFDCPVCGHNCDSQVALSEHATKRHVTKTTCEQRRQYLKFWRRKLETLDFFVIGELIKLFQRELDKRDGKEVNQKKVNAIIREMKEGGFEKIRCVMNDPVLVKHYLNLNDAGISRMDELVKKLGLNDRIELIGSVMKQFIEMVDVYGDEFKKESRYSIES